jgi:hypothetical protein
MAQFDATTPGPPVAQPNGVQSTGPSTRAPTQQLDVVQRTVDPSAAPVLLVNIQSLPTVPPPPMPLNSTPLAPLPEVMAAPPVARPASLPKPTVLASSNANPFQCEPCGANPKTLAAHNTHINTPKHKRLVAAAEKRKRLNAEAMARHQVWLDERAAAARQLT